MHPQNVACNVNSSTSTSQCAIHNKMRTQTPTAAAASYYSQPLCSGDYSKSYNFNAPYKYASILPHSKSLDQYDENFIASQSLEANAQHRHSFDQPYSSPMNYHHPADFYHQIPQPPQYDYAHKFAMDYNTPRNRLPLDYHRFAEAAALSAQFPNCGRHPLSHMGNDFDKMYKNYGLNNYPPMAPPDPIPILNRQVGKNPLHGILKKDTALNKSDREDIAEFETLPSHIKRSFNNKSNSDDHHSLYTSSKAQDSNRYSKNMLSSSDFESNDDDTDTLTFGGGGGSKSSLTTTSSSNNKHQEGIGSYESWNYVFKNLEKQGYKKNITNNNNNIKESSEVEKSFDEMGLDELKAKSFKRGGEVKSKSALVVKDNRSHTGKVVAGHEWSCNFCTYLNTNLNPQSLQICEMCSKSKDFPIKPLKPDTVVK